MKAKAKLPRRMNLATDKHVSAVDFRAAIDEMLREEKASSNQSDVPLGTIMQTTPSGKTVFRLSLLRRAERGQDRNITEIERRFREDTTSTYTPEAVVDEILWWGIPHRILGDALREPDNAEYQRTLHRVFPGAIFCFRETLDSFSRHAVTTLVSNDAVEIEKAKQWLNTVLYVHHKKGRHTISLGVRQLGLFPRLYEEVVFLRNVAKGLRNTPRYSHLNGGEYRESIVSMICKRLDIPPSRLANNWLTRILNIEKVEARYERPIAHTAQIISDCTNQESGGSSPTNTGYGEHSIRKMVSTIHPDWRSQQIIVEVAAKNAAEKFIASIVGQRRD